MQRGVGRPGWRVEDRRQRWIEAVGRGDGLSIQGPVDETIDLGIPDERRLRVTRVDQSRLEITLRRSPFGKSRRRKLATKAQSRPGIEAVFAGYAVKEMNAPGSPPQPGHIPEIGIDVPSNFIQRASCCERIRGASSGPKTDVASHVDRQVVNQNSSRGSVPASRAPA